MILSIIIGLVFIYYGVSEDSELTSLKKVGLESEVLSISDIKDEGNQSYHNRSKTAWMILNLIIPKTYSGLVTFRTQDNKIISGAIKFHGETLDKIKNHEKLTVYYRKFEPKRFHLNINEINLILVLVGVFFIILPKI